MNRIVDPPFDERFFRKGACEKLLPHDQPRSDRRDQGIQSITARIVHCTAREGTWQSEPQPGESREDVESALPSMESGALVSTIGQTEFAEGHAGTNFEKTRTVFPQLLEGCNGDSVSSDEGMEDTAQPAVRLPIDTQIGWCEWSASDAIGQTLPFPPVCIPSLLPQLLGVRKTAWIAE